MCVHGVIQHDFEHGFTHNWARRLWWERRGRGAEGEEHSLGFRSNISQSSDYLDSEKNEIESLWHQAEYLTLKYHRAKSHVKEHTYLFHRESQACPGGNNED